MTTNRDEQDQRTPRKSAREKVMDLLARRNHSELELKRKLARWYPEDEVEDAIENAKTHGWMMPPEEVAERVAVELGRKNKGHRYIDQFLRTKGLPSVARDPQAEFEKACAIVDRKRERDRGKIQRLLVNRGFDSDTIRRVLARGV